MRVVYNQISDNFLKKNLTNGKSYKIIQTYQFGNRQADYKILNDVGAEIWVNSNEFTPLHKKREEIISSLLD